MRFKVRIFSNLRKMIGGERDIIETWRTQKGWKTRSALRKHTLLFGSFVTALLIAVIFCLSLAACSKAPESEQGPQENDTETPHL